MRVVRYLCRAGAHPALINSAQSGRHCDYSLFPKDETTLDLLASASISYGIDDRFRTIARMAAGEDMVCRIDNFARWHQEMQFRFAVYDLLTTSIDEWFYQLSTLDQLGIVVTAVQVVFGEPLSKRSGLIKGLERNINRKSSAWLVHVLEDSIMGMMYRIAAER